MPPRSFLLVPAGGGGLGDQGREHLRAAAQPSWSRASNALLVKSTVWPPSRKTWSVAAANIIRSTAPGRPVRGDATAVARARSAAWSVRVSMKRRYQPASRSDPSAVVASGANGKRSAAPPCRGTRRPARARARGPGRRGPARGAGWPWRRARSARPPHPGPPVGGAEGDAPADDLGGRHPALEQPDHGLGRHQRQALLQAVVEPGEQLGGGVAGPGWPGPRPGRRGSRPGRCARRRRRGRGCRPRTGRNGRGASGR